MARITIKIKAPKIRKPVAKKPNVAFKSKKDYKRKQKHHRKIDEETDQ